jgi:hypothetical protein
MGPRSSQSAGADWGFGAEPQETNLKRRSPEGRPRKRPVAFHAAERRSSRLAIA